LFLKQLISVCLVTLGGLLILSIAATEQPGLTETTIGIGAVLGGFGAFDSLFS
jgi:hypothetical protein